MKWMFPLLVFVSTSWAGALSPMSKAGQPALPRFAHTQVWTGSKLIVWGGTHYTDAETGRQANYGDGGMYSPSTDSWEAISTAGAPAPRHNHTAVWTGTEMIIWGGLGLVGERVENGQPIFGYEMFNSGAIFNPAAGTWRAMAPAPQSLEGHTAVWTGSEMIVWGSTFEGVLGMVYNPSADAWRTISSVGAPARRQGHGAVWTGSAMAIWGGSNESEGFAGGLLPGTGASYDPAADTWTPIPSQGAPVGGNGSGAYAGERGVVLIWTGTKLVAAPINTLDMSLSSNEWLQEGGIYDPQTGQWERVGIAGLPDGRPYMAAWNGQQLFAVGSSGVDFAALAFDAAASKWKQVASGKTGSFQGRVGTWAPERRELLVFGGFWTDGVGSYSGGEYGQRGFRLLLDSAGRGSAPLKLLPPKRSVKAGKTANLKVMVSNDSTQPAAITVNFTSSNPAVPAPRSVTVAVAGKKIEKQKAKTGRASVPVDVPAGATGSTVITASVGEQQATSTLTIVSPNK